MTGKQQLPSEFKRVVNMIGMGKENAVTVSTIVKVTGLTEYTVRDIVSQCITKYHLGIGTSNTIGKSGYYWIETEAEKEETVKNLEGRAFKIAKRAAILKSLPPYNKSKLDFL